MPPPGRGQAPLDPPACQGRPITLSTVVRCAVANPHLHGCTCAPIRVPAPAARAGEAAPRPYRGMPGVPGRAFVRDGWAQSRPVGGRRCLTRRPGRAGNHASRDASAVVPSTVAAMPHARLRCAAPLARPGEAAPRPYSGAGYCRLGACLARIGVHDPSSCRGQAVPDPPALVGRQGPPSPANQGGAVAMATGVSVTGVAARRAAGRGSASPLQGWAVWHRGDGWPSPVR